MNKVFRASLRSQAYIHIVHACRTKIALIRCPLAASTYLGNSGEKGIRAERTIALAMKASELLYFLQWEGDWTPLTDNTTRASNRS